MIKITKNGIPLDKSLYTYDGETDTLSTNADDVVINAGSNSTINARYYSTIDARDNSKIKAGYGSTINARYYSTIDARDNSKIKAGYGCTIAAGSGSTISAGNYSTIAAGSGTKIKAGFGSTISAGNYSTIDARDNSKINARSGSTIKAGYGCTIDAGNNSTIKARKYSVIVRNCLFEAIVFEKDRQITICPQNIPGYVENGIYSVTGKPAIVADGILSEIVYKKKTPAASIYKVLNHGETVESYLVEQDGIFSHGATIKEAKAGLIYKISSRDTSAYNDFTLETKITLEEAIKMYRAITGACEPGSRYFVEHHAGLPKKLTVQEVIKITEGQYNHEMLVNFLNKKEGK